MPAKPAAPKPISLALQGGGTHSAFSWGVLDQLLLDERLAINAISATSGGALLAVIVAHGMLTGGRDRARELLTQFWRKVNVASGMLPLRMKVVDQFLGHAGIDLSPSSLALDYITRIFSPYQFNLFDIHPLRGIIEEMIDFPAINQKGALSLFINATNARTGKSRIFASGELSLDAVMASSCLPFIFKTVELDGESYWDGSFSGCPPLLPLTGAGMPQDIVLVQVHPAYEEEVPTAAADILDRAVELSFHSVLLKDLALVQQRNELVASGALQEAFVHFHRVEADAILASLGRASKLNAEWDFLMHLHDLGAQAASDWLEKHFDAIGKKSSADINAIAA